MDISKIRTFVHIADLRSFTRAAAFLNVSQPALSRQMRLLEHEVGAKLLHRHGHGVSLTVAGAAFFEKCKNLIRDFENLREDFGGNKSRRGLTGLVGLGVPQPMSWRLADPFLTDFRKRHSGVSLRIVEGFSGLLHEWLLSGSIDLAILYGPRTSKVITAIPLLSEDLFAIGPPTKENLRRGAITPDELDRHHLILPHKPHVIRELAEQSGMSSTPLFEADALAVMVELARIGKGFTILPMTAVSHDVEARRVAAIPIRHPPLSWTVSICHSSVRPINPAVRATLERVQEEVTRQVRSGRWPARLARSE